MSTDNNCFCFHPNVQYKLLNTRVCMHVVVCVYCQVTASNTYVYTNTLCCHFLFPALYRLATFTRTSLYLYMYWFQLLPLGRQQLYAVCVALSAISVAYFDHCLIRLALCSIFICHSDVSTHIFIVQLSNRVFDTSDRQQTGSRLSKWWMGEERIWDLIKPISKPENPSYCFPLAS